MSCKVPVLVFYCMLSKKVTIQNDTRENAVGAVLLQEGRPIACASQKVQDSELNWALNEKEILTIVFSTQKFRVRPLENNCGAD